MPKNDSGTHIFNNTPAFTTILTFLSSLFFLKISGKVAVKSGSSSAVEGVMGWGY